MFDAKRTIAPFMIAALAAGCGLGGDKGKPDLAQDQGRTFDAAEAAGGRWTEVERVESPHPYTNHLSRTFEVRGSPDAVELRVELDRFELEAGYDFLVVEGEAGIVERLTGERSGESIVVPGAWVKLHLETDYSVTRWGFSLRVLERAGCVCAEIYSPVCGADDQTYANECEASCAGARVAHPGACRAEAWISVPRAIASPHPYTNDLTHTWTIREPGASNVRVHFTRLDVERGYDFVRILDGAGQVVATYTGQRDAFTSAVVSGDTLVVELVTDYSVTAWGFEIDAYEVTGGCARDADCGAGQVCRAVECVRAPCFDVCEPAPSAGYTDVTPAGLAADPAAWDGRRVRITDTPEVRALCTRRACPPDDPCCNVCSGSFTIARNVDLRDASDQPYGCQGNDCSWGATCRAFQPENGGPYTFEGVVRVNGVGRASLLVDAFAAAACQPAGCSGQVCANTPNVNTTCEFRPEYACYRAAACEPQATGHCGWTQTPELTACLSGANATDLQATDVPLAIPDDDAAGVRSRIEVAAAGAIGEILVTVDITHTYRGDLVVTLEAPSGDRVVLHDGAGGSNDDLLILDRPLPELVGAPMGGTWSLHVRDRFARDVGTLNGWGLSIR